MPTTLQRSYKFSATYYPTSTRRMAERRSFVPPPSSVLGPPSFFIQVQFVHPLENLEMTSLRKIGGYFLHKKAYP